MAKAKAKAKANTDGIEDCRERELAVSVKRCWNRRKLRRSLVHVTDDCGRIVPTKACRRRKKVGVSVCKS